jgi:hypothetical protein
MSSVQAALSTSDGAGRVDVLQLLKRHHHVLSLYTVSVGFSHRPLGNRA